MEYQGITVTRDGDLYIDLPGLYFYSINDGHCPHYDVLEGRSLLIFNNLKFTFFFGKFMNCYCIIE